MKEWSQYKYWQRGRETTLPAHTYVSFANEINQLNNMIKTIMETYLTIQTMYVVKLGILSGQIGGSVSEIRPHKAPGLDGLRGRATAVFIT